MKSLDELIFLHVRSKVTEMTAILRGPKKQDTLRDHTLIAAFYCTSNYRIPRGGSTFNSLETVLTMFKGLKVVLMCTMFKWFKTQFSHKVERPARRIFVFISLLASHLCLFAWASPQLHVLLVAVGY